MKTEKKVKPQHELVLDYLLEHKEGITSLDAFNLFGIIQMPKRIFNLRNMGYGIVSINEVGKNRYGVEVHYVRYILKEDQ